MISEDTFPIQSHGLKTAITFDDIQIVPSFSGVPSRKNCDINTTLIPNFKKVSPIVASPMDTVVGIDMVTALDSVNVSSCIHRFQSIESQVQIAKSLFENTDRRVPVITSIGVNENAYNDFLILKDVSDAVLIDVAHGNTIMVKELLGRIRVNYPEFPVIAGNVCTYDGAMNLIRWGASSIRVGIGGGSLCETRIRTGVGVPQLTAISEASRAVRNSYLHGVISSEDMVTIISDGGIRTPADVAKAIAFGADVVMIGSLFAGTKESPGDVHRVGMWPNEHLFKKYRGSASLDTKMTHKLELDNVEGNSMMIPYKGSVIRIVNDICDGIRSAMSYVGATTLQEFRENVDFVLVTNSGIKEAAPHLMM